MTGFAITLLDTRGQVAEWVEWHGERDEMNARLSVLDEAHQWGDLTLTDGARTNGAHVIPISEGGFIQRRREQARQQSSQKGA